MQRLRVWTDENDDADVKKLQTASAATNAVVNDNNKNHDEVFFENSSFSVNEIKLTKFPYSAILSNFRGAGHVYVNDLPRVHARQCSGR